ncbi:MAG: Wzt carbohydrate-binding domain-containing protein, partial [Cyanobacteria bacterium J06600_6]
HLEPEILIVDEVLAVGDTAFQQKCLGKMEEVGRNGRTVIFVSHNMATVKQLCNKACLLSKGTLLDQGKPEAMIASYMENSLGKVNDAGQKVYQHLKGDRRAEITAITINDCDRGEVVIPVFGKIRISLQYRLNQAVERLEFFVLLHSLATGEVISSCWQKDTQDYLNPAGNQGTINLDFINNLLPDKYVITAGIYEYQKCLDWVEYAEEFTVESALADGRKYERRPGKISFQGNWSS